MNQSQRANYAKCVGKPDTIFFDLRTERIVYAYKATVKSYAKYVAGKNLKPIIIGNATKSG